MSKARGKEVLFFSRGRGHGHAIPDMAICDKMVELGIDHNVTFASYSTGAITLREAGRTVVDLGLPESNPYVPTLIKCAEVIRDQRPDIVVAHEEFAGIVAAHLAGLPSLFISAWLPPSNSVLGESLAFADTIVVIDNPGVFPVPSWVRHAPVYAGPIVRPMRFTAKDRECLRSELGWPSTSFFIVGVPGGGSPSEHRAMFQLLADSLPHVQGNDSKIVWLASRDFAQFSTLSEKLKNLQVLPFQHPVERVLSAADLIVTRGTRGITYDAAAVGVPSISISPGSNPIDDILVPRIKSNTALNQAAITGEGLASYINSLRLAPRRADPLPVTDAPAIVAREIDALAKRSPESKVQGQ